MAGNERNRTIKSLASYSSNKNIPNNNSKNILYGMEACRNKTKGIIAQQKWSLAPLPKCENSMH